MQLYLDCDGVLADFDRAATELLGMPPRDFEARFGIKAFWHEIAGHPDSTVACLSCRTRWTCSKRCATLRR